MQNHIPNSTVHRAAMSLVAAVVATVAILLLISASAVASGGIGADGPRTTSGKPGKAKILDNGKAVPPENAPKRVVRAIKAANHIRKTKYVWGGGHGDFESKGYDCSGAVSYMLHGAGMLKTPLTSGALESWGKKRKGDWITVYANSGHTWAVVAGLRWDTSGGPGPRWHKDMASKSGYKVRHYKGY
jgi:cell wall-associated NlpC family hydrolase